MNIRFKLIFEMASSLLFVILALGAVVGAASYTPIAFKAIQYGGEPYAAPEVVDQAQAAGYAMVAIAAALYILAAAFGWLSFRLAKKWRRF